MPVGGDLGWTNQTFFGMRQLQWDALNFTFSAPDDVQLFDNQVHKMVNYKHDMLFFSGGNGCRSLTIFSDTMVREIFALGNFRAFYFCHLAKWKKNFIAL